MEIHNKYTERPNKYQRARLQKGLTQEKAAELLYISVEQLSNYERDIHSPPVQIVAQMIILYDYTQLALDYFFDTPLGEYLPVVEGKEIQQAILNLIVKLNAFNQDTKDRMLEMANSKEFDKEKFNSDFELLINDLINAASETKFSKK